MARHLLALAVGPAHESVQEFIARARRCHDLWFGSWLVAAVSKAAARGIAAAIGPQGYQALLFPAPASLEDLASKSDFTVANKVLAIVPDGLDSAEVANKGKEALQRELDDIAGEIFDRIGKSDPERSVNFHEECARAQVNELFDTRWVAVRFDSDFSEARLKAERLLTACKRTRRWGQPAWPMDRRDVPKSSLDGLRESVLDERIYPKPITGTTRPAALTAEQRRRFYEVHGSERLCGVGLLKRFGRKLMLENPAERIPSTNHLAALPFLHALDQILRSLDEDDPQRKQIQEAWQNYRNKLANERALDEFRDVPHAFRSELLGDIDGGVLYAGRVREALDHAIANHDPTAKDAKIRDVQDARRSLLEKARRGEPSAYYAILAADGDSMGKLIQSLDTPEDQRELSAALADFAGANVPKSVTKGEGALIYAGGDDVLVLLPLHKALATANQIAQAFPEALRRWADRKPSLSAGLVVVHAWSPLELGLQAARAAEKLAKAQSGKNALAVVVQKRSGEPLAVCGRWDALVPRLQWLVSRQMKDELPATMIQELVALDRLTAGLDDDAKNQAQAVARADAKRILHRKDMPVQICDELCGWFDGADAIDGPTLGRQIAVAQMFSRAAKEARG